MNMAKVGKLTDIEIRLIKDAQYSKDEKGIRRIKEQLKSKYSNLCSASSDIIYFAMEERVDPRTGQKVVETGDIMCRKRPPINKIKPRGHCPSHVKSEIKAKTQRDYTGRIIQGYKCISKYVPQNKISKEQMKGYILEPNTLRDINGRPHELMYNILPLSRDELKVRTEFADKGKTMLEWLYLSTFLGTQRINDMEKQIKKGLNRADKENIRKESRVDVLASMQKSGRPIIIPPKYQRDIQNAKIIDINKLKEDKQRLDEVDRISTIDDLDKFLDDKCKKMQSSRLLVQKKYY